MNSYSKKKVIVVLGLSFLFVTIIIVGIILVNSSSLFKKKQGEVNVDFASFDNVIYLENTLPMSDEIGKKLDGDGTKEGIQGYVEFLVKEQKGIPAKFEIYLRKESVKSEIDGNYIKLYLTDMNDNALDGYDKNVIPSFKSLKVANDKPVNKILFRGNINALEEKKFKLRVWLSDSSAVEVEKKAFKMELGVRTF